MILLPCSLNLENAKKKTPQSNKLPYAAYEQRDLMSNACSSNWRSMSLYFIAAKACTCTQIRRDSPVTSHCITVMVFQSRCSIHSIFMNFPHCCFFLFPRLVGVSESLGYLRLPPLHIPFPEARGRGVTCNCQHLPTNNWGPNIEHKDSQSTLLRVKMLPAFGSGNLMPKGDTHKQFDKFEIWKMSQAPEESLSSPTRRSDVLPRSPRTLPALRHGPICALTMSCATAICWQCWQWWQCNVDMFSQRVSNAKQSYGPCGRCRRCSWPFSTGWGNTMEHMTRKCWHQGLFRSLQCGQTWGPVRAESLAGSLAWKHNDAEDADAANFAAGSDMPIVFPGRIELLPNCLWTSQGGGGRESSYAWKFHAVGDSSPPKTLLKQEGLQLAASFRDFHGQPALLLHIVFCRFPFQDLASQRILHDTSWSA